MSSLVINPNDWFQNILTLWNIQLKMQSERIPHKLAYTRKFHNPVGLVSCLTYFPDPTNFNHLKFIEPGASL
jgi:hypothetical protein